MKHDVLLWKTKQNIYDDHQLHLICYGRLLIHFQQQLYALTFLTVYREVAVDMTDMKTMAAA